MGRIHIVIDKQEKRPWTFCPSQATVSVGVLRTADYALYGDDHFAIERKSLSDFLGTICKGWDRFLREIKRMNGWPAKIVIVEATMGQLCFSEGWEDSLIPPDHDRSNMTPELVARRISDLMYAGVSVTFCDNPGYCSIIALKILQRRQEYLNSVYTTGDENGTQSKSANGVLPAIVRSVQRREGVVHTQDRQGHGQG